MISPNEKYKPKNYGYALIVNLLFVSLSQAAETEIREFMDGINYIPSSSFKHGEDEGGPYTRAKEPLIKTPQLQNVLIYNDHLSSTKYEKILMEVNPGKDGREKIEKPEEWPYSVHAQLTLFFKGKKYGGSGVLVGPHHILTAAHNVYDWKDKLQWADNIDVYPALNDAYAPFGSVKVVKAYTFKQWIYKQEPEYDMALLILNKSIGNSTGWGGMISSSDEYLKSFDVSIAGYPADKKFKELWTMTHKLKIIYPERFSYVIDTFAGQSGSPIWAKIGNHPYIIGVHTLGGKDENFGARLSHHKFKNYIVRWIKETYILQDSPTATPLPSPSLDKNLKALHFTPSSAPEKVTKKHDKSKQDRLATTLLPSPSLDKNLKALHSVPFHTPEKVTKKRDRSNSNPNDGMSALPAKKEKINPASLNLKELAAKVGFRDERIKDEFILAKNFLDRINDLGISKAFIADKLKTTKYILDGFIRGKDTKEPQKIVTQLKKILNQPNSEFTKEVKDVLSPKKKKR